MTVTQSNRFTLSSMSVGNKRPWDDGTANSDQHFLLAHHSEMFIEDMAEWLKRTPAAVQIKAAKMGCSMKSKPKVSNV